MLLDVALSIACRRNNRIEWAGNADWVATVTDKATDSV